MATGVMSDGGGFVTNFFGLDFGLKQRKNAGSGYRRHSVINLVDFAPAHNRRGTELRLNSVPFRENFTVQKQ